MTKSYRKLIKPYRLQSGDLIGIWTPSFPGPALYPRRYQRGIEALRNAGFQVIPGPHCLNNAGFAAASPYKLAEEFHAFLRNSDIRAIITTIGGWSMSAVLPHINFQLWHNNPKLVIGYSDITCLLLAGYTLSRIVTFHGPMVLSEWGEAGGPWEYTLKMFLHITTNDTAPGPIAPPDIWTDQFLSWDREDKRAREPKGTSRWRFIRSGRAEGALLGGCLPTVTLLLGTRYEPCWDGAILFLETEEMSPDKFWAHLLLLKESGVLDKVRGLMIGRHSRPTTMATGFGDFEYILMAVLGKRQVPVLVDVELGHTEPMLTLPVGCIARLDSYGDEALEILETPVS